MGKPFASRASHTTVSHNRPDKFLYDQGNPWIDQQEK